VTSGNTSRRDTGEPPVCPRCRSNKNVRHVSWVTGWSCRWCAWELHWRQLEHDLARLLEEAERITRRAA
jgi:ribosomal protein L37AE/L43A